MSRTPLLDAAPAAENLFRAGASEKPAEKNISARERLRAHELAAAFGNGTQEGRRARELAAAVAAEYVIRTGASEKPAGKNICTGERLGAHGNRRGDGEMTWALTHEGRRACELAAGASSLADELRGSDLDFFVRPARSVAASAAAYAESLRDPKTANSLELSIAEFNRLLNNTRPKNVSTSFTEVLRKSSMVLRQYRPRPHANERKPMEEDAGVKPNSNLKREPADGNPDPSTEPKNNAGATEPKNSEPRRPMPISEAVIGKRQVLYGMALGAPVALLTSAAGLQLFPGGWAWVAGAGAGVWILATAGMVLNQFGQMSWEHVAGRHLGRFGVLGAALFMCFFAYRAFFPSFDIGLIILFCIALGSVGYPWIRSCFTTDDDSTATTSETIATDGIV